MASPRPPRASDADVTPLHGARVLIVEARFYDDIADELLAGALGAVTAAGASAEVLSMPGALEIPTAIAIALDAAAAAGTPYDAAVALGCVVRGETYHFEIVAGESSRALMDLAVSRQLPLGNGILTVENDAQAWVRARVSEGNKGAGAVEAALALLRLKRRVGQA
ncbi:6,7-dimethyl-8-ribityllumazine synthase [Angulomicrobium tetraedrale]|uniref:6,7-dimethyl-8-ribityllumazine synthase n=1 Tax=Ancylobacter tetraedralis TaxID=217068 RepID=A0A839ZDU5_9HYPH|nr:6,7-dimethyl-8-ribityllumazine synthase [Ancylobacter tetraedralis]MBB3772973.1 6,7-dimethyl-8-ribityllumazine synthase [Ancylobacter tetraedralis]